MHESAVIDARARQEQAAPAAYSLDVPLDDQMDAIKHYSKSTQISYLESAIAGLGSGPPANLGSSRSPGHMQNDMDGASEHSWRDIRDPTPDKPTIDVPRAQEEDYFDLSPNIHSPIDAIHPGRQSRFIVTSTPSIVHRTPELSSTSPHATSNWKKNQFQPPNPNDIPLGVRTLPDTNQSKHILRAPPPAFANDGGVAADQEGSMGVSRSTPRKSRRGLGDAWATSDRHPTSPYDGRVRTSSIDAEPRARPQPSESPTYASSRSRGRRRERNEYRPHDAQPRRQGSLRQDFSGNTHLQRAAIRERRSSPSYGPLSNAAAQADGHHLKGGGGSGRRCIDERRNQWGYNNGNRAPRDPSGAWRRRKRRAVGEPGARGY